MSAIDTFYNRLLSACADWRTPDKALTTVIDRNPVHFGNMVMPPAYKQENSIRGSRKHDERRIFVNGRWESAVVLDSVASMADRLEWTALKSGKQFRMPQVIIEVNGILLSLLRVPHRAYGRHILETDLWLDDLGTKKVPFLETQYGLGLNKGTKERDKQLALLGICPQAIVLGCWGSTIRGDTRPYASSRVFKGEVLGKLEDVGRSLDKTTFISIGMIDPLGPSGEVAGSAGETKRASEDNLGNIPPVLVHGGAVVEWAKECALISISTLHTTYGVDPETDHFVRAYLASWALYAHVLWNSQDVFRSGCQLTATKATVEYAWVTTDEPGSVTLDIKQAEHLYNMALKPLVDKKLINPDLKVTLHANKSLSDWHKSAGIKKEKVKKAKKAEEGE